MTIKARIYLITSIILLFVVIVGSIMFWNFREVETGFDQMVLSSQVIRSAFLLRALMDEYLDQGDARPLRQWNKHYESLGKIIHDAKSFHSFNPVLLRDLEDKYKHIGPLHAQVIQLGAVDNTRAETKAVRQTLTGIMSVRLEELVNSAENLQIAAQSLTLGRQRIAQTSTLAAFVLMFGLIVLNLYFMRRSVLYPIQKLSQGAEIIGAGNFDHRIELNSKDELGVLAKSFNMMTERLKTSYDSLRTEIQEREQAQEALQRFNEELEIRVKDRTAELTKAHNILEQELHERKKAEEALRESEERLRLAQSSADVGVWDWHPGSGKITWTQELERLYGYAEGTFPGTYESFSERVHPDDLARIERLCDEAVKASQPFDFDFRIQLPSGETRWINCKGAAHYDGAGNPDRIFGVNADITERKRAEDELKKAHDELELRVKERTKELLLSNEELERSNADLQHFAYVASHDLQEPLRNVASTLQMFEKLHKGKLDQESDQLIDYAVDAAKKMKALISDLLTYSRVTSQGQQFEEIDVRLVLDQTLRNLKSRIAEKGTEITYDEMPTVRGDATQLLQIFQNLIGNAVKFGSRESPKVHVSAQRNFNEWMFAVKDNGIGIEPQHFDRIFVIFQQLNKRGSFDGTGMGLAIVKRIVERHHGRVWLESEVGVGSTFYFTIPEGLEA